MSDNDPIMELGVEVFVDHFFPTEFTGGHFIPFIVTKAREAFQFIVPVWSA
jgi:hypothetical protein